MQTASLNLMTPISDIADTISFGLVGKIRKKTHSSGNNIVQTVPKLNVPDKCLKSADSIASLPKSTTHLSTNDPREHCAFLKRGSNCSSTSLPHADFGLVGDLQRHNTITAAYNFSGSIMNSDIDDCEKHYQMARSNSLRHTTHTIPNPKRASSSSKFCPRETKLFKKKSNDSPNLVRQKSDSSLNKKKTARKVTISNDTTDLESGELVSLHASTITQSTLNSKNSSLQRHSVPVKSLPKYSVVDHMDTIPNDNETSSLYSCNSTQPQFRLVLDDHIIPGVPSVNELKQKHFASR